MNIQTDSPGDREMRVYQVSVGEGPHKIDILATLCGADLALNICGGHKYHIGAAALAVPRPSLDDPQKISATASVLAVTGHKEDELARRAALLMAAARNCTVTAIVGIHIDNATEKDLAILTENCFGALNTLLAEQQTGNNS